MVAKIKSDSSNTLMFVIVIVIATNFSVKKKFMHLNVDTTPHFKFLSFYKDTLTFKSGFKPNIVA
jgi:hypothetical protein